MVISRITLAKLFNLIHTEIPHLLNGGKIDLTSKVVGSITGDNECEVLNTEVNSHGFSPSNSDKNCR